MRAPSPRFVRLAFLAVLLLALAQVLWWILDQAETGRDLENRRIELLQQELRIAEALADRISPAEAAELFPSLRRQGDGWALRREELEAIRGERRSHLRQYLWEGAFFAAVLIAVMSVIWRALREEQRLRRRQESFLATVSHELRSPLQSLQLAQETMLGRPLDAERRERLLRRSVDDVRRLERLVSKLLESSALDSGRVQLVAEPVELHAAVDRVLAELAASTPAAAAVANQVPESLLVDADPVALETIVRNLVENAVRATAGTGGGITTGARRDDGAVELWVEDGGKGFDPAERQRLFEKFYRLDPGDPASGPGTGLGLFIVASLTRLMGGEVRAQSAGPGRGARFAVRLPAGETA